MDKNERNKEKYWTFSVRVKREYKDLVLDKCEARGITPSRYVNLLFASVIDGFEPINDATKKGDKRK